MKLKKIDTTSENYHKVRGAVGFVSGVGAGFTLECMSIPWVKTIFKSRAMRAVCFSGIVPMATLVSLLSKGTAETIVDAYAQCWNFVADKVNGREEPDISDWFKQEEDYSGVIQTKMTFMGIDIPGKNASPSEEKQFVDDVIEAIRPFEFDTVEDAKKAIEDTHALFSSTDAVDLCYYFSSVFGRTLPHEAYDIFLKYGWTKEDAKNWGVDKITDNVSVADMFNYHDISDVYETLKED